MPLTNPTKINVSAGGASNNMSAVVFSNSNNVSFGLNGSTITASASNAQTVQSIGLYALGNTTQNSSTTLDARTLSFNGLGMVTVGYSNGSIQISATQTVQSIGLYGLGNTTQNSSTTLDARTVSFNGLGAMTVGFSNGSVQMSAPATSSLSATGGVSISTNGSTISIGVPIYGTLSAYDPFFPHSSTVSSSAAPANWVFNRIVLPHHIAISNINVFKSVSGATSYPSSSNATANYAHSYSHGITIFTRQDFGANSTNISYLTTASIGVTMGYTYSTSSQTIVVSWVTNTTGGTTSFSTTSNATGLISRYLTGLKIFQIPMITTLTAGEYFFAHAHSSTTGRTSGNDTTAMSYSNMIVNSQLTGITFGHISTSGSYVASYVGGQGFGPASAVTTNNTMALSVISMNASANYWYMNFSNA